MKKLGVSTIPNELIARGQLDIMRLTRTTLHRFRAYSTSACPGALHTPEGELATIGPLNVPPHEEGPSRQWTGWRTNLLPLSSLHLPLDACSEAAADAIEASELRFHPKRFDLVVSGGGLAAFYGGAVSSVLGTLAHRKVLQVGSLHGVSSGALVCATFLGCESGLTKLSSIYRCHEIFVHRFRGLAGSRTEPKLTISERSSDPSLRAEQPTQNWSGQGVPFRTP
jgi:hypothetical protein